MRTILFALAAVLLLVGCSQKGEERYFFNKTKGYPDFNTSKEQLPLFGFDSLVIDSLSTLIDGKNYWYLNTTSNALLNINGYIRSGERVIYIKSGNKDESKTNKEQVLFDFSCDTTKSWIVKYQRDGVTRNLAIRASGCFYNQLIKDSAVVFKVYNEAESTSFSEDFLIQVSLQEGIVSFKYLVRPQKRIYTIDYLPTASVKYDTVRTTLYQVQ